jgi:hypothetical protein
MLRQMYHPKPRLRAVSRLARLVALLGAALLLTGCAYPSASPGQDIVAPVIGPVALRTVAGSGSGAAALLAEARSELAAMRSTRYQHTTDVDPATGRFFYDCSGFVDYALTKARPQAAAALSSTQPAGRPLAQNFEQYLRQLPPGGNRWWTSVHTVAQLRPGDIVSWLITPDSQSRDTGHVMIVLAVPVPDPHRAGEWLINVVDSTTSPHARDSRIGTTRGLGTGTVGLSVDQTGSPTGFYWRGGVTPHVKLTQVALGETK